MQTKRSCPKGFSSRRSHMHSSLLGNFVKYFISRAAHILQNETLNLRSKSTPAITARWACATAQEETLATGGRKYMFY